MERYETIAANVKLKYCEFTFSRYAKKTDVSI